MIMRHPLRPLRAAGLLTLVTVSLHAQNSPPTRDASSRAIVLTLRESVRTALGNHPQLIAARANVQAAGGDLALARAARLPTLDVQWQTLRATGNAVAGAHFGMLGVPAVGGPPGNASPTGGVWGATAALVTALPITGMLRTQRVIDARLARSEAATARLDNDQLHVAATAASAFLEARAALAHVRVAQASRRRALAIDSVTRALAAQGLRPGADSIRTVAEVASTEIELARADQMVAVAHARLAAAVGTDQAVRADTSAIRIMTLPNQYPTPRVTPAEREAGAAVKEALAEQRVAAAAWLPRVDLLGAAVSRGSGEPVPGVPSAAPMRGIVPNVNNWAVGVMASWPLTGITALRAQERRAAADADGARARLRALQHQIEAGRAEAEATVLGTKRIAERTVKLVSAAASAVGQIVARYRAGLTSLVEVADAQRQLTRAEVDDALAQIEVIAAQLQRAQANGDLAQFLALVDAGRAP